MDVDFLLRAIQVATVKYVDETWGTFGERRYKTVNDGKSGQGYYRMECL